MDPRDRVAAELHELARLAAAAADQSHVLTAMARRFREALRRGGTLYLAGNGGSAAQALHVAAEYVVRYRRERGALPAVALAADPAVLTAAANDLGFEQVFARQVEALCRPGDLLVLHSTSGESPNLLAAAAAARRVGVPVVAFLGRGGGPLADLADAAFLAAADSGSRIQELHLAAHHIIVGLIEDEAV